MRQIATTIQNQRYDTLILPDIETRDTDLFIISREGDRLDLLSQQFYSTPEFWWILAQANSLGKGSLTVPAGIQIRIPSPIDSGYVSSLLRTTGDAR